MAKRGSIFKLSSFTKGPQLQNTCDLICLGTQEGLSAGDKADKLYKMKMEAYGGDGPVYTRTSEYPGQYGSRACISSPQAMSLMRCRSNKIKEIKKEMDMYGMESSEGKYYRFYNVLWLECKGRIAYRGAVGRVLKAI
ncbi:hypothetical protein COCMIDRAFT_41672 [Bipolaris oryzae ATCC 44560]|uniref:Uncharacterized protein n=1 Tax=Bipolaris oryzae ATCC 44560 TaxID=930090 RepID=W6YQH2_COCMI|nr:uncharacterized protein COCMIDRAFT_41672 [Bipolaris oryzae ATCC 44560]EUC39905.1 hypothetical protein COCMIDRAFT_41672 [Bipolaris oryzae ATCC 44560]